jgi:hypothetical protein
MGISALERRANHIFHTFADSAQLRVGGSGSLKKLSGVVDKPADNHFIFSRRIHFPIPPKLPKYLKFKIQDKDGV